VAYRLRHLRDPRLRHVLTAAAQAAKWEARPSTRPAPGRSGTVSGRGVACVLYEGDNGYCAMVADVDVNQDTGAIAVKRLVVAIDCGPISNPDGVRAQVEGGALQGVSRALREEVRWDQRKVTTVDWNGYPSLTLADAMPVVETILVDQPDAPACGAGETSITVTAAAIGNAIWDATGARLRQLPFTPERVRAARKSSGV
jgi:nicotinate dehydrogenase subunit B